MMNRRTLLTLGSAAIPAGLLTLRPTRVAASPLQHLGTEDVARWIRAYGAAWQDKDADAASALFTPDAIYEALPGVADQTYIGRAAIRSYWQSVTAGQSDVTISYGEPIVRCHRAAVELWVTMRVPALNPNGDHMVTLIETNILTFATRELVSRNVEYWNLMTGTVAPPEGWGGD